MSIGILATVFDELKERRRLFIENNISSVDFEAARMTSHGMLDQIFEELHSEAENSISDTEKLLKVFISICLCVCVTMYLSVYALVMSFLLLVLHAPLIALS